MMRYLRSLFPILPLLTVLARLLAAQSAPQPAASRDATQGLDATVVATQEYLNTGHARTIQTGDFLAFPYGKSQPTLTCAPLRTCLIRLQAGESILETPALGDSERWIIGVMATGPNGTTPLIYVKPTDCDITTNLVISTDRHLYQVLLDAPPCPKGVINNTRAAYTWHLTFYYPDELAQQWAAHAAARATDVVLAPSGAGMSPDQLNFAYEVKKDRKFPWSPEHVFDDRVHLYVQRPSTAQQSTAPLLFGLDADGKRVLLNYTLRGDYYITDRVMDRVVLLITDGSKEYRLTMTRMGGRHG